MVQKLRLGSMGVLGLFIKDPPFSDKKSNGNPLAGQAGCRLADAASGKSSPGGFGNLGNGGDDLFYILI